MNRPVPSLLLAGLLLLPPALPAAADGRDAAAPELPADTSRVVDVEEAVVVASPKENVRLRRQPVAVSLFGRADLQARGVADIKGLSSLAPNFFMPDYGSRYTSAVYIRGIGSRTNNPAVGLYVDNLPYTEKAGYDFSFADVERVDVMRGPQGTLYGRNTMGGLVRVFTADPLRAGGTELRLGATTREGGRRASVATGFRPAESLGLRLSAYYDGAEGFRRNALTGRRADGSDAGGGRLRLAWLPADRWRVDVQAAYEQSREDACPYRYVGTVDPADGAEPYPDAVGLITQNRQSSYRRHLLTSGVGATWTGPRLTLSSTTSYQYVGDRLFMDQDFLAADIFSLEQRQRLHTLTEELVLKSPAGGRWQWTSGAWFSYRAASTRCPVVFYDDGIDYLNGLLADVFASVEAMPGMSVRLTDPSLALGARLETPSLGAALYHQSTVRHLFVRGLSLTAGLRLDYARDRLRLGPDRSQEAAYSFALPAFGVDASLVAPTALAGRSSEDAWQLLPKVALQYDLPGGRGNVYACVAKGSRAGGYNVQAYSDLAQSALRRAMMLGVADESARVIRSLPFLPEASKEQIVAAMHEAMDAYVPAEPRADELYYRPEQTWQYEAGAHLNLFGGALQMDAACFLMNTKDQQLARFARSGMGRTTVNAGRSRSYGAELSLRAALWRDRLALAAAYGYTHAAFTRYDAGDGADYTGRRVPYAPEHTFSASADLRQPLSGRFVRALSAGVAVAGAGRIWWDETNTFGQPFYATLSARIGVELSAGVEVELWGRNLTDVRYDTFVFDSMGRRYAQQADPVRFGADVRLRF